MRIQVKSRWATDYDGGFLIRNFDTDFVAFVELNRGYRYSRKGRSESGRKARRVFVFPVSVVRDAQSKTSTWGKVFLRSIDDVESYLDSWEQVRASLSGQPIAVAARSISPEARLDGKESRVPLHVEIERVLENAGGPLRARAIASAVYASGFYRKHDRSEITPQQIHARVSKYPDRFTRTPSGIDLSRRAH